MICYNCQREIVDGSRYCYHCGAAQETGRSRVPPPPAKPLRRSRRHKAIAGVCAGIAEHFGFDIALVRVLWLLVAIFGGGGFIAYLVCWLVIPLEEVEEVYPGAAPNQTSP